MQALVDLLGDPQRAFRGIHLTGTNGKTSTARMIDELLRGFGLRTGRYTSPHLTSVTERIVVDGAAGQRPRRSSRPTASSRRTSNWSTASSTSRCRSSRS